MIVIAADDFQKHFDECLQTVQSVQSGEQIIITSNGKPVAALIPPEPCEIGLTESLTGILQNDYDDKAGHRERHKKYDSR